MASDAQLRAYYAKRAAEYERIYDKPERQADLARLKSELPELFTGAALLEIACGTGYWTPLLAARAASVLATDANEEVLAIARTKPYPRGNVHFERCDAYALPAWKEKFDGCFAGFWWSHVPKRLLADFLQGVHARLVPGACVAFLDNRYVEGNSTAIARRDAEGNTYQRRRLADGSEHEVLKNFPAAGEIEALLGARCSDFAWRELDYYWYCSYRTAD